MRSLEARFINIEKKHPFWSSYICFAQAVIGMGFSRAAITSWFHKLVDKDDYDKKDEPKLFEHLVGLSGIYKKRILSEKQKESVTKMKEGLRSLREQVKT